METSDEVSFKHFPPTLANSWFNKVVFDNMEGPKWSGFTLTQNTGNKNLLLQ